MSRIGRLPVELPAGVKARLDDGNLFIEGPRGKLQQAIPAGIKVMLDDKLLRVERESDTRQDRALHGLVRSLANNMVLGVTKGFSKTLWLVGVGYTAKKQGSKLVLQLGFANPVEFEVPQGMSISDPVAGSIPSGSRSMPMMSFTITGADKQGVGQLAASIRAAKKPEPYLGKGIRYHDEHIRRKAGKRFTSGG